MKGSVMEVKDQTAYCGIYCKDCIHLNNEYSELAKGLQKHLKEIEFDKYAAIDSEFGKEFKPWDKFSIVLSKLSDTQCEKPCRSGGGCSGKPCKIMECCQDKNFAGCWECSDIEQCDKFDFLEPRCGDMPKMNIREIRKYGIDNWVDKRANFYIWQK